MAGLKADIKAALTANLSAAHRTRVINAFSTAYSYPATVPDPAFVATPQNPTAPMIPNPQSAADFAAEKIVGYINEIVVAQETQAAKAAVPVVSGITIT